MKHNNKNFESIQDTKKDSRIPKDEPVFLIRGQDKLGPQILRTYADMYDLMGGQRAISAGVRAQAFKMEEWQARTGTSKIAD